MDDQLAEPGRGQEPPPDRTAPRDEGRRTLTGLRGGAERLLARAEDAIYAVIAAVLVVLATLVLISGVGQFVAALGNLRQAALNLLDSVLLVLMLAELLHTVSISLREHALIPEPFLIVGLIAAIRRVLVITAEQGAPTEAEAASFRLAMLELGILGVLIVGLVAGLVALSRWRQPFEER